MGITPRDPADFDPTMGDYKSLRPFRFWCQKVLPLVYDDSLSYYEVLCKVVDYLNKSMEDVGVLHEDVEALNTAYQQLQKYVNDYFSTLDVQEEINNKLDVMASDGTLDALLLPYFNAYKAEINQIVANQNQNISSFENSVDDSIASKNQNIDALTRRMDTFSHLTEGSTTGDAELMDIRVGQDGITYPTAGQAVRGQFGNVYSCINGLCNDGEIGVELAPFEQGTISDVTGEKTSSNEVIRTENFIKLPLNTEYRVVCPPTDDAFKFAVLTYDANKVFISSSYWTSKEYVLDNKNGSIYYIKIKIYSDSVTVTPQDVPDISMTTIVKNTEDIKEIDANTSSIIDFVRGTKVGCNIENGTVPNFNNQTHVRVSNFIPCKPEDVAYLEVTKPLVNNTDYYVFGYVVYDSEYNQVKKVDVNDYNITQYIVKIPENGSYIRFTIGERDSNGQEVTLRKTHFVGYPTSVYVQDSNSLLLYLETSGFSMSEELPNYWVEYLQSNKATINKKISDYVGYRGDNFIFYTDVHWDENEKHSPAIIRWLRNNTPIIESIQGGDILDKHSSIDSALAVLENYLSYTRDLKTVNLIGNHDNNSNGQSTETGKFIGLNRFYRLMNSETESTVNWVANTNYGYSDNIVQKIRKVFLDTGTPDMATIDETQQEWFANIVGELDSSWTVIVFAHMLFTPAGIEEENLQMNSNGWTVCNILNTVLGHTSHPHIACVISGHTHRDFSLIDPYSHTFPVICTISDACSTTLDADPNSQYVPNTVTAQALDIFCVDTTNKTVKAVRIGNGSDRNWSYSN